MAHFRLLGDLAPHQHGNGGLLGSPENAGATWVDKAAFREGNLVWGRVVPDIPDFCRELVAALAEEYRGLTCLEQERSQGRNSMRTSRKASGFSMCGVCPQSAMTSSR